MSLSIAAPLPQAATLIGRMAALLPPLVLTIGLAIAAPHADAATRGSGTVATETRTAADFDGIAINGSMTLEVRQAAREAVSISADDNVLPLIETVVEGRTLKVRMKRGESVSTRTPIKVSVDVVKLSAVASAGAGDIRIDGLKTPLLKFSVAGSGDAALKALQADALEVSIAGSGNVRGDGMARQVKLSIAGSGDAMLTDLVADDVTVSIAGSGDAKVTANKSLSATVAGSGDVKYRGTAATVRSSVMGSGTIRKE